MGYKPPKMKVLGSHGRLYNLYQSWNDTLEGQPWRLLPALRCLRLQAGRWRSDEAKGRWEIYPPPENKLGGGFKYLLDISSLFGEDSHFG